MKKREKMVALSVALLATFSMGCGGTSVQQQLSDNESAETEKEDGTTTVTWWTWSTEAKDAYEKYAEMVTESTLISQ